MATTQAYKNSASFPDPPRVVWRKLRSGCGLAFIRLFILPHTIVGLGLLFWLTVRVFDIHIGYPVTAVVDHLETKTGRGGNHLYLVFVRYAVQGRNYENNLSVDSSIYSSVHPGDSIDGHALKIGDASTFLGPRSWDNMWTPTLLMFTLFWNGLLSPFLYTVWIEPIRRRSLVKHGLAVPGKVFSLERSRRRGRYDVGYTFRTLQGEDQTATQDISRQAFVSASEGMPITVIYDLQKPRRSLPYELSDFTVRSGDS